MIRLTITGGEEVAATLRARGPQIIQALTRKMDALMIALQAHVVGDKLSGQVLQHRSGKLANSIRAIPATEDGSEVQGWVEGGGGPAFYGRFHEYGTTRSYTDKKALAFMLNGKLTIVKSALHPPIKERSFMRSSLADMQADIVAGLQESVDEAVSS